MNADGTMRPRGGNHYIHYRFFTPAIVKDWGQSDIGLGGGPYIYMATQTRIYENNGARTDGSWLTARYGDGNPDSTFMLYDGYLTGIKVKSRNNKATRIEGVFDDAYNYYGTQDNGKIVRSFHSVYR